MSHLRSISIAVIEEERERSLNWNTELTTDQLKFLLWAVLSPVRSLLSVFAREKSQSFFKSWHTLLIRDTLTPDGEHPTT